MAPLSEPPSSQWSLKLIDWRALTGALPLSSSGPIQPESPSSAVREGRSLALLSFLYKCPPGDPTVWLGLRTTRKAHCNFKVPILTLKSLGFLEVLCVLILSHSPQVLALPFRGGSAGLAWNLITSLEPAPSSPAGCLFTSGEASGFIYGF